MKRKSMKAILTLGMPGLIVSVVIALFISTQLSTKMAFTDHARSIMQNIASCTIDKARSHLNPARDAALLTSELAVNNIVASSDVARMENYFYRQLLINNQFSNIYFGTMDGEFIMVSRKAENDYLSKIISIEAGERTVNFKETDSNLSVLREYTDPFDSYDPRIRPWYIKALNERGVIWTNPYIFYTSRNPGITTASPVFDSQGNVVGVVGVDIEISDLSDFISELEIGQNGKAFILDETGKVIAYPEKSMITHKIDKSEELELVDIGGLNDDISRAAYNALNELDYDFGANDELFFSFDHDGEAYHAMFAPFHVSYWPWLMGIYIPQDDYMGRLKKNRNYTLSITLILGLLTAFIGFQISHSILASLKKLQDAAKQVGGGNLHKRFELEAEYAELEETVSVFELMRSSLESYTSRMEQMVQDRTKAIEDKNVELGEEVRQRIKAEEELIFARNEAEESLIIAEKANKAKNTFLANISHEMRTPLTGILGYAELIDQSNSEAVNAKFRETIILESSRLLVLINRLLDLSKIETGQIVINERIFSFRDSVKAAWNDVGTRLEEKGLEKSFSIDAGVPDLLVGDPDLLTQVLSNLLSNGVKFTEKGFVSLAVNLLEKAKGEVSLCISIEDTGIGIHPEKKEEIFKIFNQGDNSISRRFGGTGLGLAIVRDLVALMNGRIELDSTPSSGSVFKIFLDFQLPDEEAAEGTADLLELADVRFDGLKVLLVEDYKISRELVGYFLKGTGCILEIAENGRIALEVFKKFKPDVILMDVQMPEMDGIEATKLIRQEDPDVWISGLTANAFPQDLISYKEAGMNDCLVKPFRKQELFDSLNRESSIADMEMAQPVKGTVVFDPDVLLENLEGDREMALEVLIGFRDASRESLEYLESVEGITDKAHRLAHSMKSGALNVGAERLASAAEKLEKIAKDQDAQRFASGIYKLAKEFKQWENLAGRWEDELRVAD